jgi:hypothetical protein
VEGGAKRQRVMELPCPMRQRSIEKTEVLCYKVLYVVYRDREYYRDRGGIETRVAGARGEARGVP